MGVGRLCFLGRFFIRQWAGPDFDDAYWLIIAMTTPLFIPLVQNTGIEIQRAKNRHRARSIAYLCMAVVNVTLTVVLAPFLGCWAPAIGYAAYVVLGCGLFMNWYYQHGIGLDMGYFWRHVIPVLIGRCRVRSLLVRYFGCSCFELGMVHRVGSRIHCSVWACGL